jgi:hypothetical protein
MTSSETCLSSYADITELNRNMKMELNFHKRLKENVIIIIKINYHNTV